MTDNETGAAEATVHDHARRAIDLMKRGAHMTLKGIEGDASFLSSHFGPEVTAELGKLLEAALASQAMIVTPEMIDVALSAFQSGDMDWSSQDEELMRFALEEAMTVAPMSRLLKEARPYVEDRLHRLDGEIDGSVALLLNKISAALASQAQSGETVETPAPQTHAEVLRPVRTFVMAVRAEAKGKDQNRYAYCDELLTKLDAALGIVRPVGPDTSPVENPAPQPNTATPSTPNSGETR